MAFFKVAAACVLLAATAMAAPQLTLRDIAADPEANPLGLTEAELAADMYDPNPQYTYSYQVAADPTQTYIAMQESRDGQDVAGEYSYVDPLGNLITVTYTAGADGYQESRSVQAGFVQIRASPIQEVVSQVVQTETGSTDTDLVANIISQLTPFIKSTVSTSLTSDASVAPAVSRTITSSVPALTSTRTITSSAPVAVAAPVVTSSVVSTSSAAEPATAAIFGLGGPNNVAFETPDFSFIYDLSKK